MAAGGVLVVDVLMIPAPPLAMFSWAALTLVACPVMFLKAVHARQRAGDQRSRPWRWVLVGILLAAAVGLVTVGTNLLLWTMVLPVRF